jgi:hypothetical protein
MAQATNALNTNPLAAAHVALLAAITVEKPHRIRFQADALDLEERAADVQAIGNAFVVYLSELMEDTASVAPGGNLRDAAADALAGITDNLTDLVGAIANLTESVAADESGRAA